MGELLEFVKRENEIFRILKRLVEKELDVIVVGGYAVSGLARHRFSVDCDLVVPKRELRNLEELLEKEGFEGHFSKKGFDKTYAGEFISFRKGVNELPVTIDLLVGSLVCRATEAAWSFDYIREHSVEATISGIEMVVNCRVPERELLLAFKIHSGRRTDIRDIAMMMEESDMKKLLNHLRKGKIDALKAQVSSIIKTLDDEKLIDSLKGVFTLTADVKKQIASTKKKMESIQENVLLDT